MKVQDVVRSMPWVKWERGLSQCYRDTSYTRTQKKIRFKFDRIETTYADKAGLEIQTAELTTALFADGHEVELVQVLPNHVCIWQSFPIQIIEAAAS